MVGAIASFVYIYTVARITIPPSRAIGRCCAMAKTPLLTVLTEHVKAAPVIRALHAEECKTYGW